MSIKSFGAKTVSKSSSRVGGGDKAIPKNPQAPGVVNFEANCIIRPAWMKKEFEDAYLLGCLMIIFNKAEKVTYSRSEICQMVYGRPVVTEEEDRKLERAMWELHRCGVVTLENRRLK
jgi:hypothetical protein